MVEDQKEKNAGESATGRGFRDAFESAGKSLGKVFDKATGAEFLRYFEEFTDAATTAIIGIHRDQIEIRKLLSKLESLRPPETPRPLTSGLSLWSLILSLIALALSIVALVRG